MRILLAPSNVANQSWSIAQGLRALGHHVEIWNYGESPNEFPVDRVLSFSEDSAAPLQYVKILQEALIGFDVVHFHTARSLFPERLGMPQMWDLPILRAGGKRIVFSFHGSDIRKASHHREDDRWSFYRFGDIPCDEERIDARLAIIRTFAHHMTVSCILDQPYVPEATYLPKSLFLPDYPKVGQVNHDLPVVLHATRRRVTKGTDLIIERIERLQRRVPFEFRFVEGASHPDLMKEMAAADIVVEKLLGGDAGVISLEAMALGKVAMARIRKEVLGVHPGLPVVSADPDSFEYELERLLLSPELRKSIGEAGREYVVINHSAEVAARLLVPIYEAAKPSLARPHPDWASNPSERKLESAYNRISRLETRIAELRARL